jgi:hypothetical protein
MKKKINQVKSDLKVVKIHEFLPSNPARKVAIRIENKLIIVKRQNNVLIPCIFKSIKTLSVEMIKVKVKHIFVIIQLQEKVVWKKIKLI